MNCMCCGGPIDVWPGKDPCEWCDSCARRLVGELIVELKECLPHIPAAVYEDAKKVIDRAEGKVRL